MGKFVYSIYFCIESIHTEQEKLHVILTILTVWNETEREKLHSAFQGLSSHFLITRRKGEERRLFNVKFSIIYWILLPNVTLCSLLLSFLSSFASRTTRISFRNTIWVDINRATDWRSKENSTGFHSTLSEIKILLFFLDAPYFAASHSTHNHHENSACLDFLEKVYNMMAQVKVTESIAFKKVLSIRWKKCVT